MLGKEVPVISHFSISRVDKSWFVGKIQQAGYADYVRWPQYSADNLIYRLNEFARPSFHKKVAWLNSQWGGSSVSEE